LQGRQLLRGFFASNRGNMGIDEVYLFEKLSVEEIITAPKDSTIVVAPPVKKDTTTVVKEEVYDYDIYVAGKVIEQPEKNKPATRPKAIARADLGQKDLNGESISYKSDKNGFFIKQLKGGTSYEFIARADSFLSKSVIISTKGLKRPEPGGVVTINLEIPLERITRDKEYVLENIYYDTDKFFIRNDAKPTLESLARMLQLNPEINIELGSHTDCRADDDYNLELSQNRAQSAVDYLVSLGVNQTRLLAKGYGETQFAVNCQCENCTEAQNQQNRRTSFRIR
ncbi:MAG: OmpA family protein, partial [Saprospiraceae bacterium]